MQSVGIFIHPDLIPDLPTRNIVVTGNTIIRDPHPAGRRPIAIEVMGTTDTVNITGNTIVGGMCALSLGQLWAYATPEEYKKIIENTARHTIKGNPLAPQNVIFANNICRDQTGPWLYIDSRLPMSAMITGNIFTPKENTPVVFGELTRGVVFTNNVFSSGDFPKDLPPGIVWGTNYVGPKFKNSPPLSKQMSVIRDQNYPATQPTK